MIWPSRPLVRSSRLPEMGTLKASNTTPKLQLVNALTSKTTMNPEQKK